MVPYSEEEMEFRIPGGTNFLVRIQFRQHATWQGTIQWLEVNKTLSFRSMLEMVHLMEEAVERHTDLERQHHLRSWNKVQEDKQTASAEAGCGGVKPFKRKR